MRHHFSTIGIQRQHHLFDAVGEWTKQQSVKYVQSFVELSNYYRMFLHNYAEIVTLILNFVGMKRFVWENTQEDALKTLKDAFTSALVVLHPTVEEILSCILMHPKTRRKRHCNISHILLPFCLIGSPIQKHMGHRRPRAASFDDFFAILGHILKG